MQVSAKLISCALLPLLASFVPITFADVKVNPDKQLIQFMASFQNVIQIVDDVHVLYQILDQRYTHHDRTDEKEIKQRYFECNTFYKKDGPAILVLGGLHEFTDEYFKQPLWLEIAQKTKGVLYGLEHRCYGQSFALDDKFRYNNVHYCNTEEALSDILHFIVTIKGLSDKNVNLKWIVVGEGHAGNLAAWTRLQFPHFIQSAMAINAPLLPKLNYSDFFEDVSMQLKEIDGVMDTIQYAYEMIDFDINNNRLDELEYRLNLCGNPADSDSDVQKKNIQYMLWSITWNLGLILELKDTMKEMYKTKVLDIFANPLGRNPVEVLSDALKLILRQYNEKCIHTNYEELVDWLKNCDKYKRPELPPTVKSGLGNREYFWASCTEFGHMKTSTKKNMFGDVPLDFFIGLCMDIFGLSYDKKLLINSIETTNMFYNWKHIKIDNILFVNYDRYKYKQLLLTEYYFDNHDIKIVNIPDVPDTVTLKQKERYILREKYNEIYDYIMKMTEVNNLELPNIVARRVPHKDDEQTDEQLIQFMITFTNVKYVVDGAIIRSGDFLQQFNHLDRLHTGQWGQLHYMNEDFYEEGGPVLLVLGGLAELTGIDLQNPVWTEMAQRSRGVLFALEHRCYGRSRPQYDDEEFLQLCNSEQQLYDIARFIAIYKMRYTTAKWVVLGESHGGKLAAWSRLKFPSLVNGAVSINAPLRPKKEFNEFYDIISYKLSKLGIMETIQDAYRTIEKDIIENKFDDLTDYLKLCSNPADSDPEVQKKNIQYMFWSITWNLGIINILRDTKRKNFKTNLLEIFKNKNNSVQKLSQALQIILSRYDLQCTHVNYQEAVNYLKNPDPSFYKQFVTLTTGLGNREHFWQSCTEFGYMKTSTKKNMFGDVPLDFYIGLCTDVFGPWYNENILDKSIQTTNMFYNGINIDSTNILFINYIGDCENIFEHTQNHEKQEFKVINIREVPDNPKNLKYLRKRYNDIYNYLEEFTDITYLVPARLTAQRLPYLDEELIQTDKQLIQFMKSFMDVRQIVDEDKDRVHKNWFHQVYNHLNRNTNIETNFWRQNYYMNDKYHKNNGPAILIIGGLTALTEEGFRNLVWTELAQRTGGILYALENRCYGTSIPLELGHKYLQLCNTEQQLYDIASFIEAYQMLHPESKWLVVGESHAGKLAAWIRFKFPSLVDIAVAINAPLVPQKEFSEYFDHVSQKLSKEPGVMNTIQDAYNTIANDIKNNGLEQLKEKLKLCSNPANSETEIQEKNIQYMLWSITWNLGTITKLKDTAKENVLQTLAGDSETDPVQKLSNALKIILSWYESDCIHVNYQEAVEHLKTSVSNLDKKFVTLTKGLGNREYFWQSCTEFGYMKTSTKENMFGDVPLDFFIGLCIDVFGPLYREDLLDRSIQTTNMFYNGKDIDTSNTIFINYESDINYKFAMNEYTVYHDIVIKNIPDIPDDPDKLSITMSTELRRDYDDIFEYLRVLAEINHLELPDVKARRLPDLGEESKKNEAAGTSSEVRIDSKNEKDKGKVIPSKKNEGGEEDTSNYQTDNIEHSVRIEPQLGNNDVGKKSDENEVPSGSS